MADHRKEQKHYNTGVMNKLRDKMPVIIIIVIVAFLATIVFEWGMNLLGLREDRQLFAKVNGEEITYQQFEQAVEQQANQMRQQNNGKDIDDAQMQQIRDQVWNGLITQSITRDALKKYNITVSDKEILDWIYNRPDQLPDPIKKNFMDSTGTFNVGFYQQALGMKTKEATQFWSQVENYLREVLQSEKLQSILTAGVRVTEADVLQKYKDDKIFANISYTALDQSMVTDTNLNNPSIEEMKKYYDEHKDDFKVDESVKFKYVVFSDAATAEDTAATQKLLEVLLKDFKTAAIEDSSLIRLVNDNSVSPYSDAFQKPNSLGPDAMKFLFSAKPGDVSNIIMGNDGYKVMRLIDTKEGEDTYVNASHILVNFGTDTAAAKKKAEEIYKRVKAGEDINTLAQQLSDEPSAKTQKGDLGWFGKGAMVKEFEDASFAAKDGEIVGPVKTQFGFHIIQVKGKSKKEFKVAEIKKPVTAGARTKDIAKKKAEGFYLDVDKGGNIDTLAKQMNLTCTTTADVLKDGFIPGAGQNKKLMKLALDSKAGKVFEPLKVQGGYGVYKLIDKTPAGYRNFDSIKTTMVKPKVVEKKKFAVLKQMATDLRAKIQNNDIKSLSTLTPPSVVETADSVSVSKPAAKIGQDYAVTDAIFSMKQGEISQPIKGTRGYYLIQLNTVTPFNQEDYLKAYNDIRNSLLMQKKQSVVQEWLQKMQNDADIIDNRDRFFN
ncbi:MAG: peptidylprolyl isomerase [Bacteroidetes bacterium]|nr:peptidylprolyl isomerase [Bacteroidota bacterium]